MNIQLIAPKSIWDFSSEEFRSYIQGLYYNPKASKGPVAQITLRFNKKGNPVITCKRKPKSVTREEIAALSHEHGVPKHKLWVWMKKRNIEITQ